MEYSVKSQFLLTLSLVFISSITSAQTPVLQDEPPVVLKAHKLAPYELPAGSVFDLVLENADEIMPVALVSYDIYDFYHNVTIPRGSRVVGKYRGFKGGRHLVEWDGLQLPSRAGTLRIEPPLLGTMRDGTTGYIQYRPGAAVGATNFQEFIIPQK
jgi:type IV secretory pathway VirB10-like protein